VIWLLARHGECILRRELRRAIGEGWGNRVGLFAEHEEQVEQVKHGRDLRCVNRDCQLYGVLLEVDEIEVDGDEARCAVCQKVLVLWTDVADA